ncbi:MAG: glycerate kinase [Crocosphaera sp.]|nr:glycerate kinase [Crocosphaera sp.]
MISLKILQKLLETNSISSRDMEILLQEELANVYVCDAFNLTVEKGLEKINHRIDLLQKTYPIISQEYQQLNYKDKELILLLWQFWLPLAIKLSEEKSKQKYPFIQGILGGQGTGKTTLSKILCIILKQLGYQTVTLSIDDFYKTYEERQKLHTNDPRFIWRGPPGTHDIALGIKTLEQLKAPDYSQPIFIPRFDKSLWNGQGDRIKPDIISQPDIVLFEGWFVGVFPINETEFNHSPSPIKTEKDIQFAKDINQQLKAYLPLWNQLDSLMILYPQDYRLSKKWRKEAEQKMILSGKTGMNEQQIDEFVNYFWKALHPQLFITPLIQNQNLVDLVITIDANHHPQKITFNG